MLYVVYCVSSPCHAFYFKGQDQVQHPAVYSGGVLVRGGFMALGLGNPDWKKSRIRETKHLSTDADSSTDAIGRWTKAK